MGSTAGAFAYRDVSQHGKPQFARRCVNFAKGIPATATTGNLFGVTGTIVVTGLFGIVATALASATKPTLGVTGFPAVIAAAPTTGFTGATGNVIIMPPTAGGALPALVTSSGATSAASVFIVEAANITITTDVSNASGNITWVLEYVPLLPKGAATVVAS